METTKTRIAPDPRPPAIEIRRLTKDYPLGFGRWRLRAVDDLSLTVAPGQIYGVLGPNGSGKSTTLKVLLGLITPSAGECYLNGIRSDDPAARRAVGFLPEVPDFQRFLSGRELLRFHARLCGVPRVGRETRIAELIDQVGLKGAADRHLSTYSKGMIQRLGLAQALVHDPAVLILDEPTAGVDPLGAEAISALILDLKARGKTVLLCSHLLTQIEEICDRVAILHRGRLLAEGSLVGLLGQGDRQSLVIEPLAAEELADLREWLASRGRKILGVDSLPVRLDRFFSRAVTQAENEAGVKGAAGSLRP
ncbi:MAG: ABC transporter ATP-binding protein [Opitutaceae bacterium]|nr:ABC transporter ATP-binding protein [Opitutaceae bacterium]